MTTAANDSQNSNNNSKSKDNAYETHSVVAYKYSNNKRGPLYESVILADHPMFIKYENGQVKAVNHIQEGNRIIRPPSKEEYPYPAYEFCQMNELEAYMNRAKNEVTGVESLYSKAKEIVLK